ncbi:hypothetical protein NDU88_003889 [Pleurodeles waltl]|uniref:Uncharacterized protein n=1 Tax=Pleurodeles waltl TaxID=8319 RepID=A0AAV7T6R6_PLEWA|nr:hypothetical protein NDU88_003889 [Pleurodeles waltl]
MSVPQPPPLSSPAPPHLHRTPPLSNLRPEDELPSRDHLLARWPAGLSRPHCRSPWAQVISAAAAAISIAGTLTP